jgi:hypothetical protein
MKKHLKDIVFYDNDVTEGYRGPAFKVGSGVQGIDIYQAASEQGLIIVGGICDAKLYGKAIYLSSRVELTIT